MHECIYTQRISANAAEIARILSRMFREVLNNENETLTVTLPHCAWLQLYEWLVKIGVVPEGWRNDGNGY